MSNPSSNIDTGMTSLRHLKIGGVAPFSSNYRLVRRAMLDQLPLQPSQIHPVRGDLPPQQAADDYETRLKSFFSGEAPRFDLALLGLGDDGHTASLLPGSAALAETKRWTAVTQRAAEDFSRVTLTAPILNQSRVVLFLVSGGGKAAMLKSILFGHDATVPYPAEWIRPLSGDTRWYVDREAAALIDGALVR